MLNITEVKEKAKGLLEENKEKVKAAAVITGVAVSSYILGSRITDLKVTGGLQAMRADGVLKFFDPVTGLEAKTTKEACDIMRNLNK